MLQNSVNLFGIPYNDLLQKVKEHFPKSEYDYNRHVIHLLDENGDAMGHLRLPLFLSIDNELSVTNEQALVLYLSIESGNAAISVMAGSVNQYHTTFSAYMTRKKQGVSQIKYLNKKGKSRAGSRVRLAATIEFFENINSKLQELFQMYKFDRIGLDCNTTLIPYLYQSKETCPFDKRDSRLYKIPLHIPQSNFTQLDKAIKKLKAPLLFYEKKYQDAIDRLQSGLQG